MTPEATVIIVNLVFLGFAYLWVYPGLPEITLASILWRDVAVSLAALSVAGLLFAGTNTAFSLLIVETNWFIFSVLSMMLLEAPIFAWFAYKHDIDL